ncbi:hypothetical protein SEA_BUBBABEAR_43 [Microbacterium phage BubbaBear]|uniref:hypothetical protein n=1 Tax=Microbacterium phage BubbaBear TaxID=2572529 RepID=UPI0010C256E6|nr:hypothetical protein QDW44_gp43 [Microbacterium phage BubbaBear]QCG77304.1 hypothetical protein SEA_BUBBABEAR_43 [Microbacterium phage BubbaBear]
MTDTPPTLETLMATYLRVRQLIADIGDAQWRAGKSPVPKEDTTERSKGLTSDPTPSIVVDSRRMALRLAVIEAEQALEKAGRNLQAAERHLNDAFERWQG